MPPRRRRPHGHVETLPSGSFRVRVYGGMDPLTKRRRNNLETTPTYELAISERGRPPRGGHHGDDRPLDCALAGCRRSPVVLEMAGSSLKRHSQEAGAAQGAALRERRVGATSCRRYVATLASRFGGPPRDSFLSSPRR